MGIPVSPKHKGDFSIHCKACIHNVMFCSIISSCSGNRTKTYTGLGRTVALEAHGIWARWAAAALGRQLAASMEQDPALTSQVPLRNWIDTVVKHVSTLLPNLFPSFRVTQLCTYRFQICFGSMQLLCNVARIQGQREVQGCREADCGESAQEDELGGAAEEMRFSLPAAASPAAQAALLGGCREVARAGGHAVAEPALALLAWELGGAVLTAFRCATRSVQCWLLQGC